MTDLVLDHYGYKKEDTVMLLDTKKNMKKKKFSEKFPDRRPTRDNIVRCFTKFIIRLTYRVCNKQIREISNLVKGAKPGDHFFFHCTCRNPLPQRNRFNKPRQTLAMETKFPAARAT